MEVSEMKATSLLLLMGRCLSYSILILETFSCSVHSAWVSIFDPPPMLVTVFLKRQRWWFWVVLLQKTFQSNFRVIRFNFTVWRGQSRGETCHFREGYTRERWLCLLPKRTGLQSGDYMPWPAKSLPVNSSEPDGDATDALCHHR